MHSVQAVSSSPRGNIWAAVRESCANRARHLSGGIGDYSTILAAPGTLLHNDIMESASRKQTGYAVHEIGLEHAC